MYSQNMYNQAMYNQQNMYQQNGYNQMYQNCYPKVSKTQAIQYLQNYMYQNTGCFPEKIHKINEIPQAIKHACFYTGIQYLGQQYITIPSVDGNIVMYYYYCTSCHTLFVYNDFM